MSDILITGAAGFIGNELALRLASEQRSVVGIDNLNDYYEISLKQARLARLQPYPGFRFEKLDLCDRAGLQALFATVRPRFVIHLAAQAGVRYSLECPQAYVDSNITGFVNLMECCRQHPPEHLIFASSSSTYGLNTKQPFSPHHEASHPVSFYAATKRAGELMAHAYSHLFRLPATGLRFFTVYGPWSRPDMAPLKFAHKIMREEPIELYNHGNHRRDFTYIGDIVEGIVRVLDNPAPRGNPEWAADQPDPASSSAPYRVYNIGNGQSVELLHYIELLEKYLGRKAKRNYIEAQAGDVESTWADVSDLARDHGYAPQTPLETGVANFVRWYKEFYQVQ